MAIINIDEKEYKRALEIVKKDKLANPTLKNYVSKALKEYNDKYEKNRM
jgi:hypothetical protein